MLAKDLSDLPRPERAEGAGLMPDAEPKYVGVLVEAWAAERDDDKPTAFGTRMRHSDAAKCSRALSFGAAGFKRSDPMDLSGTWTTTLGTLIHSEWQVALQAAFPDAEVEVKVGHDDLDASGHIDAVVTEVHPDGAGEWVTAIELKTLGGWAYKAAIGKARRGTPAEGPKNEHLTQAALNGLAVDADVVVVAYLARESVSASVGAGLSELTRFACEWSFTREQYEPIALAEKARMNGILALVDSGTLAARKVPFEIPAHAEIIDPTTGRWEETDADGNVIDVGTYWMCPSYCPWRTLCATTPSGRIPVDSVVAIRGAA